MATQVPPFDGRTTSSNNQLDHSAGTLSARNERTWQGIMMTADTTLREHLTYLLSGGGAHLNFERAIADLPASLRGAQVEGTTHTPWRLLEHLRICQWDILEFTRDPDHISPEFPDGCWPTTTAPPSAEAWDASADAFRADLQAMIELVNDPATDLYTPLPHGDGQTVLREALLVADHNAYHLGQLVLLRRCLGAWE
tara:strand:- start:43 stop:633 length:591 start_codon:yes stop_codon:yes gene_type:complete